MQLFIEELAKELINNLVVKIPQGNIALVHLHKRTRSSINVLGHYFDIVIKTRDPDIFITPSKILKKQVRKEIITNPLSINDIIGYYEKKNINKEYHCFSQTDVW